MHNGAKYLLPLHRKKISTTIKKIELVPNPDNARLILIS